MYILYGFFLLKEFFKRLLFFINFKVVVILGFYEFGLIEMKIYLLINDY